MFRPSRNVFATFSQITLAAALLASLVACKKDSAPPPASAAKPAALVLELLPSDVWRVERGALQQVLTVSGSVRATEQAVVKAKLAGEVKQILVREGETVKAGQILARIEQADYLARVEQSRGALKAAQGQLEIARKTRNNNLQLKQQNFISQNAADTAESQYVIAQANFDSAKAALDVAQKALQDTNLYAPVSGVVSVRNVQPGEKVSPDARLLEIVDLRQLELEMAVPSSEIGSLANGQRVMLEIEGIAAKVEGNISRINPATQAGSRSILAYVKLQPGPQQLRVGMFAQAKVVLQQQDDVLRIPQSALYFVEGEKAAKQASVYLIVDGKLQLQSVATGALGEDAQGTMIEIKSGLQAGQQIIKTNLGNLNPGTAVALTKAKPVAANTSAPRKPG